MNFNDQTESIYTLIRRAAKEESVESSIYKDLDTKINGTDHSKQQQVYAAIATATKTSVQLYKGPR